MLSCTSGSTDVCKLIELERSRIKVDRNLSGQLPVETDSFFEYQTHVVAEAYLPTASACNL